MRRIFAISILAASIALLAGGARAQTAAPYLIVTWRAHNFYPSDFAGKALPTPGTTVTTALGVVSGGQPLDLSQAKITWFLDEEFLEEGKGLQETRFVARESSRGYQLVRVSIMNDRGTFEGAVTVPVVAPQVVIEFPSFQGMARVGDEITARAVPYFFNVRSLGELSFAWQVNGAWRRAQAGANAVTAKIGALEGATSRVAPLAVAATNLGNQLESARGTKEIPLAP